MLTVAVTGPTGEIGKPFIGALERTAEVDRVLGMARRPFDPTACGWKKVEYRRGDILDRAAVDDLVEGADVVVHLAFIIMTGGGESRAINLVGSRNVFEAAAAAGAKRLVYASSVAAYGFHGDNPRLLTEDMPLRGSSAHPYSEQKAEVEQVLVDALAGSATDAYVFRPCIVAGPDAPIMVESIPLIGLDEHLPLAVRRIVSSAPLPKPVIPDTGVSFQLVHHDDVAAALCAAAVGKGSPGIYNLAAPGEVMITDLAHELGWHAIPVPRLALDATAEVVARVPLLPNQASWIEALRWPVLMDTARARRELDWHPRHDARETLRQMVAAWRERRSAIDDSPILRR